MLWVAGLLARPRCWSPSTGAGFDLPLLQTRFLMSRMRLDLEEWPHFDLLPRRGASGARPTAPAPCRAWSATSWASGARRTWRLPHPRHLPPVPARRRRPVSAAGLQPQPGGRPGHGRRRRAGLPPSSTTVSTGAVHQAEASVRGGSTRPRWRSGRRRRTSAVSEAAAPRRPARPEERSCRTCAGGPPGPGPAPQAPAPARGRRRRLGASRRRGPGAVGGGLVELSKYWEHRRAPCAPGTTPPGPPALAGSLPAGGPSPARLFPLAREPAPSAPAPRTTSPGAWPASNRSARARRDRPHLAG